MTATRVRWMVGIAVVGLHLAGGLALAAASQSVSGQMGITGDQRQQDGDYAMYVVSGQGMATIDGQQVPFAPGTVLYIPNGAPYSIKAEGGDLTLKMLIGLGNLNAELSGTLNPETFSFDPAPVPDGPAGTFAFTSDFCNIGSKRLSEIKSVTTTLTGGHVLLNRDSGTRPGDGSELTFPANGGFADLELSPGECVEVLYRLGLAAPEPFDFFVDVFGVIIPSAEIAAATPSQQRIAGSTGSGRRPPAIGLLHGGSGGLAERLLK
jgi:hypothetical protein